MHLTQKGESETSFSSSSALSAAVAPAFLSFALPATEAATVPEYENVALASPSGGTEEKEAGEGGDNSDGTLTNESTPNAKTPNAAEEGKQVRERYCATMPNDF